MRYLKKDISLSKRPPKPLFGVRPSLLRTGYHHHNNNTNNTPKAKSSSMFSLPVSASSPQKSSSFKAARAGANKIFKSDIQKNNGCTRSVASVSAVPSIIADLADGSSVATAVAGVAAIGAAGAALVLSDPEKDARR